MNPALVRINPRSRIPTYIQTYSGYVSSTAPTLNATRTNAPQNFQSGENLNRFANGPVSPSDGGFAIGTGNGFGIGIPGDGDGAGKGVPTPGGGFGQGIGIGCGNGSGIVGMRYAVLGGTYGLLGGMRGFPVGGLPVVGSGGRVAGVFTPAIASQTAAALPLATIQMSNAPPRNANAGRIMLPYRVVSAILGAYPSRPCAPATSASHSHAAMQ